MSALVPKAVLMNGMPKASVFCDEHSRAAVRVGGSKPGNSLPEIIQNIPLNDKYATGMATIKFSNEELATPMPFMNVSENTL